VLIDRLWRLGAAGLVGTTGLMLASLPIASSVRVPSQPAGFLRVVFLDVGQGDSTLVRFPDRRTLLVDAGGLPGASFDIGERVIAPAIRAFGIRSVETMVLTHGDPDHIGGVPAILRRFSPREIWEGVPVPPHLALRQLSSSAGLAGILPGSKPELRAGVFEPARAAPDFFLQGSDGAPVSLARVGATSASPCLPATG